MQKSQPPVGPSSLDSAPASRPAAVAKNRSINIDSPEDTIPTYKAPFFFFQTVPPLASFSFKISLIADRVIGSTIWLRKGQTSHTYVISAYQGSIQILYSLGTATFLRDDTNPMLSSCLTTFVPLLVWSR